jgi:FixJ family two-component response regulator
MSYCLHSAAGVTLRTMVPPSICVVDDDESVRESVEGLLRSIGMAVETFDSAEAFLASGAELRACCLILDISMPNMSGTELQQVLADRGSRLPIVFITARADRGVIARLLERGALACLFKPFDEQDLLSLVTAASTAQFEPGKS